MTQAKPIKATFSDFKLVKGRKVAQLVFEVTTDQADEALAALGGLPRPDAEKWFGIVALDLSKAASEPEKQQIGARKFETLPAPQQAALRCNDPNFRNYLGAKDIDDAARLVRNFCMVESRSELATNPKARAEWVKLDDEFFKWQTGFR